MLRFSRIFLLFTFFESTAGMIEYLEIIWGFSAVFVLSYLTASNSLHRKGSGSPRDPRAVSRRPTRQVTRTDVRECALWTIGR